MKQEEMTRKDSARSERVTKKRGRTNSGQQPFYQWLFQTMAHSQRAERGEVRYLILDALADKARHGYDIIREIARRSQDVYSPSTGVVYPTLHFLEESGFVSTCERDGVKLFEITKEGKAELEEKREEVENAYDRLCGHVPVLQGENFMTMGKQVDRIFKSLKKSLQLGQVGSSKIDEMNSVLEAAAIQIEKILKDKTP